MKTSTLTVLSGFLLAAVQGMPASAGDVSWYDPVRNASCTGHVADGHISCQLGQIEAPMEGGGASGAPAPGTGETHDLDLDIMEPTAIASRAEQPEDEEEHENPNICAGEGQAKAIGCFVNCYGQGFCDAQCSAKNECLCSCVDGAAKGDVPCGMLKGGC